MFEYVLRVVCCVLCDVRDWLFCCRLLCVGCYVLVVMCCVLIEVGCCSCVERLLVVGLWYSIVGFGCSVDGCFFLLFIVDCWLLSVVYCALCVVCCVLFVCDVSLFVVC